VELTVDEPWLEPQFPLPTCQELQSQP
jgi:hypothetical protein